MLRVSNANWQIGLGAVIKPLFSRPATGELDDSTLPANIERAEREPAGRALRGNVSVLSSSACGYEMERSLAHSRNIPAPARSGWGIPGIFPRLQLRLASPWNIPAFRAPQLANPSCVLAPPRVGDRSGWTIPRIF
eukprot:881022-Prorocentrum_minimum.AAC.1